MKCPGQDMQFWKPGDIYEVPCPSCARTVEFFKDDTARRCGHCGHRFANPKMDFGCAAYCPYAEQCLGDLPPEVAAQQESLLKDRVAVAVKQYYGRDFRRIGRASRVARYAEQIAKTEAANLAVVLTAAYLLEVDRAPGSDSPAEAIPADQAVARAILDKLQARADMIEAVCGLIERHAAPGGEASLEQRVLRDAVLLADLEERQKDGALDAAISRTMVSECCTAACQEQAQALLSRSISI